MLCSNIIVARLRTVFYHIGLTKRVSTASTVSLDYNDILIIDDSYCTDHLGGRLTEFNLINAQFSYIVC
jgi:hypothetical protein